MQNVNQKFKSDLKRRCFLFSLQIIELTNTLPSKRSAYITADQLIRSATSIGANIIEARASSSRLEFKKFYEIALKSANETTYWLELLKESHISPVKKIDILLQEAHELASMLGVIKLQQKTF